MSRTTDKNKRSRRNIFIPITIYPEQLQWVKKTAIETDKTDSEILRAAINRLTTISQYADPKRIFDRLPARMNGMDELATSTNFRVNEEMETELKRLIRDYGLVNKSYAIRVGIEAMRKQPIKLS